MFQEDDYMYVNVDVTKHKRNVIGGDVTIKAEVKRHRHAVTEA